MTIFHRSQKEAKSSLFKTEHNLANETASIRHEKSLLIGKLKQSKDAEHRLMKEIDILKKILEHRERSKNKRLQCNKEEQIEKQEQNKEKNRLRYLENVIRKKMKKQQICKTKQKKEKKNLNINLHNTSKKNTKQKERNKR